LNDQTATTTIDDVANRIYLVFTEGGMGASRGDPEQLQRALWLVVMSWLSLVLVRRAVARRQQGVLDTVERQRVLQPKPELMAT
jgi:hypothetical protein